MKVTNVRPWAVEIAATGQTVEGGSTVEVDNKLGEALCAQPDNWKKATAAKAASKDDD